MIGASMEVRKLSELNPAPYNPRKMLKPGTPKYQQLRASIEEFGLVDPIVWNKRSGHIVGGHQRFQILKDLKAEETEVRVVDLSDLKEKKLNLALNKIGGDWVDDDLAALLMELSKGGEDLKAAGFSQDELDEWIGPPDPKPEVEFSPELLIQHNYVVLYFDNALDWQVALERFGIKSVKQRFSGKVDQVGIGRVLKGAAWLDRIK